MHFDTDSKLLVFVSFTQENVLLQQPTKSKHLKLTSSLPQVDRSTLILFCVTNYPLTHFQLTLNGVCVAIALNLHLCSFSQLRNGNLHYISDAGVGGKVERTVGDAVLSDGQWHTLRLVKNGSATVLQVDSSHSRAIQHPTQDFGSLSVLTFSLGGIPPGPAQQKTAAGEAQQCIYDVFDATVGNAHNAHPHFNVVSIPNVHYAVGMGRVPSKKLLVFSPP